MEDRCSNTAGEEEEMRSVFENLAVGHQPRLRVKQAISLAKLKQSEGCIFDVEDDGFGDDYNYDDDDGEEVYDDDKLANFYYYSNPDDEFDDGDKKAVTTKCGERVPLCKYLASTNFASVEAGMTSLIDGGLVKKLIIQEGNGQQIPGKCKIFYHYEAMYEGGTEAYDSTLFRKRPACLDLRQQPPHTFPGLEVALRSMSVGELSRFIIYPELGFGELGCAPRIPKNVKLLFVIELLQVLDEKQLSQPQYMTVGERAGLPFPLILEACKGIQTEGNGLFVKSSYHSAIRKWWRGVNMLEDYPVTLEEDEVRRTQLIGQLYANLAQGFLELERGAQACSACKVGLKVVSGPDSFKLVIRFAKAKLMLGDYEASLSLCNDADKLCSRMADVNQIRQVRNEVREAKRERDAMWRNIFNKPKKKKTTSPKQVLAKDSSPLPQPKTKMSTSKAAPPAKVNKSLSKETGGGGGGGGGGDGDVVVVDKCTKEGGLRDVDDDDETSDFIKKFNWDDEELVPPDYAYSKQYN